MAKSFKIGKIYKFNYERLHQVITTSDDCTIELKPEYAGALIERLTANADLIAQSYADRKKALAGYLGNVRKLESMKARKKANGLTKSEQAVLEELEADVACDKDLYFPKGQKETDKQRMAENLFSRNYVPENVELDDDGRVTAVYAGPSLTATGKTVHRWYVLGEATTREPYTHGLKKYLIIS